MPQYATPADLWVYMGKTGAPDEAFTEKTTPLLRRASSLVTNAIRGAIYEILPASGIPSDPLKAEAVGEATCAQASAWQSNGIDPYMGRAGAKQQIASKGLGSASIQYASYAADAQARSDLASGDVLISEAWRVLDAAGMLSTNVQSGGAGRDVYPVWYSLDPLTGNVGNVPRTF